MRLDHFDAPRQFHGSVREMLAPSTHKMMLDRNLGVELQERRKHGVAVSVAHHRERSC